MNIEIYLTEQIKLHPFMQPQDIIKMCYQAAFGAEHLLSDLTGAKNYLTREYAQVSATNGMLWEPISPNVCRINLSVWKSRDLPLEWLFRMFVSSCKIEDNAVEQFKEYLQATERILSSLKVTFTKADWDTYLNEYKKTGIHAVHHSETYRLKESPAYRIVDSRFCKLLTILEKAKEYPKKTAPCIIAIDGRAASGKTTLAHMLQQVLDADIIHMDDFFVPPALRTEERFSIPGENIHHERFCEEVLPFISVKEPFSHQIFDCSIMDYQGYRQIGTNPFRIVEGSYSCHPKFGAYADITVFSTISSAEQQMRIRKRNGEEMLKMFVKRWIPLEEDYFNYYFVKDRADIIIE